MASFTVNELAAALGLPTRICPQHSTPEWVCQYLDHDLYLCVPGLT